MTTSTTAAPGASRGTTARPLVASLPARLALVAVLVVHALPHLMGVAVGLNPPSADACANPDTLGCTSWLHQPGWIGPVIVVLWCVAAIGFLVLAWAAFTKQPWTARALLIASAASGVLCALGLPGAKIGLAVNLALIGWLAVMALVRRRSER